MTRVLGAATQIGTDTGHAGQVEFPVSRFAGLKVLGACEGYLMFQVVSCQIHDYNTSINNNIKLGG
jgi:hypothetical protein